ncbi:hypothetical protein K438DRAFT_1961764 [Mycena galopus ATCC 62051]|nr:hypothetical protein K438DRAFT_1961764 [Mycena galopus ATCC 62051]
MHKIHHHFFPNQQLEKTLSIVGTDDGEWGWALEEKVFGGVASVTWPSDSVGDFSKVVELTVQGRWMGVPKKLTSENAESFLLALAQGEVSNLSLLAEDVASEPSPPLVNNRGPVPFYASPVDLGLILPPGLVWSCTYQFIHPFSDVLRRT